MSVRLTQWAGQAVAWCTMLRNFDDCCSRGLAASLIDQVLIEESVDGWEELELEVVSDAKNQKITVCFIENIDAMGVHTGDSFCAAPMLTIDPELAAESFRNILTRSSMPLALLAEQTSSLPMIPKTAG